MKRLNTFVTTHRREEGDIVESATFGPGDDLPEWAIDAITNDDVWDTDGDEGVTEPPRAGPGSGKAAWSEWATSHGVDVPDRATRDEIIDLVDASQQF